MAKPFKLDEGGGAGGTVDRDPVRQPSPRRVVKMAADDATTVSDASEQLRAPLTGRVQRWGEAGAPKAPMKVG